MVTGALKTLAAQISDGGAYLDQVKQKFNADAANWVWNTETANDKINDVAVIGLPDSRLGEIAAAIIQAKDGIDLKEEEIVDFCLDLPRYKRPHKIIFADVPRNPTGKIEKPKLREIYCGESVVAKQNEIK